MLNTRRVVCLAAGFAACVVALAVANPTGASGQSGATTGPTPVTGNPPTNLAGGHANSAHATERLPGVPPVVKACACVCKFPAQGQIVLAGAKKGPGAGTTYSFNANASVNCTGPGCKVTKVAYAWKHTGGTSVSVYTSAGDLKTYFENVTRAGTLSLECTVTVTCSDGTKCSSKGSKTFTLTP